MAPNFPRESIAADPFCLRLRWEIRLPPSRRHSVSSGCGSALRLPEAVEGPEPYVRGIRIAIASVLAYVFLRVGSYYCLPLDR
jgi:hypothetical protein